jgi:hypothetical protein
MYPLVKIPSFANKSFFEFTRDEAKQYLQWFLSIRDERISILESQVKQSYLKWNADYTKGALIDLYNWFKKQVSYRKMTDEEKEQIRNQVSRTPLLVGVIPTPGVTFTDETVSICFDVGLYFGETLIANIQSLKWMQKISSTNFIYYAQPLLAKTKSKVPVNPRASVEGIGRRILDKDVQEITFETLFDKWCEKFTTT